MSHKPDYPQNMLRWRFVKFDAHNANPGEMTQGSLTAEQAVAGRWMPREAGSRETRH